MALPTLLALSAVRAGDIDDVRARGADAGARAPASEASSPTLRATRGRRPLAIFFVCAVLFHFANAAMLPLLGEMLAKGRGRVSMLFLSACVVTTQLVIALLASWSGRAAARSHRRHPGASPIGRHRF